MSDASAFSTRHLFLASLKGDRIADSSSPQPAQGDVSSANIRRWALGISALVLALLSVLLYVVVTRLWFESRMEEAVQKNSLGTTANDEEANSPSRELEKSASEPATDRGDGGKIAKEAPEDGNPESVKDLPVYSANFVAREYIRNELAADEKFKGRRFVVCGDIDAIKKNSLSSGSYIVLKGSGLLRTIHCWFGEDDEYKLRAYSTGEQIGVVGTCDGLTGAVFMKKCVMVAYVQVATEGNALREYYEGPQGSTKRDSFRSFRGADGKYYSQDELSKLDFSRDPVVQARLAEERRVEREQAEARAAEAEAREAAENAEKAKAEEDAKYRVWTSANGKHTSEAQLLSYGSGVITVETRDHKKLKVPLEKLSKEDQEFIAKWRKDRIDGKDRKEKKGQDEEKN